jgi:hypothetical protein
VPFSSDIVFSPASPSFAAGLVYTQYLTPSQYTNACTCREGDADITSVVGEDTTILAWVPRNARG